MESLRTTANFWYSVAHSNGLEADWWQYCQHLLFKNALASLFEISIIMVADISRFTQTKDCSKVFIAASFICKPVINKICE